MFEMVNKCVHDIYLLIKSCIIAFFVVFLHSKIFYNERFDNYILWGNAFFLILLFVYC